MTFRKVRRLNPVVLLKFGKAITKPFDFALVEELKKCSKKSEWVAFEVISLYSCHVNY